MTFIPALHPDPADGPPAAVRWLAFDRDRLLVDPGAAPPLPLASELSSLGLPLVRRQYLGLLEGSPCFSAELASPCPPPPGLELADLRQVFRRWGEELFRLAGLAFQIKEWDRTNRFCGACGRPTVDSPNERAKLCPDCGLLSFPRISPAVIVAVGKGRQILLARARRFTSKMFSVLAGFVEPGETLEECVQREVREEVGIEVGNIRYFGSQPWPFPNSLMVGFLADYAGGELRVSEAEIVEAGWFQPEELPEIPTRLSIARRLIDAFLEKQARSGG